MDPVCQLIFTGDVGEHPLAWVQRLVQQVSQVLAPACAPLFLTDGLREYLPRVCPPLRPVEALRAP
jgi:hypothetical protein